MKPSAFRSFIKGLILLESCLLAVQKPFILQAETNDSPAFKDYAVTDTSGVIKYEETFYYRVNSFYTGQDYLIVASNEALGTDDSISWTAEIQSTGSGSLRLKVGNYYLTCSDNGLALTESRRPTPPTAETATAPAAPAPQPPGNRGSWSYDGNHLAYRSGQDTYYLTYRAPASQPTSLLQSISQQRDPDPETEEAEVNDEVDETLPTEEAETDEPASDAQDNTETETEKTEEAEPPLSLPPTESSSTTHGGLGATLAFSTEPNTTGFGCSKDSRKAMTIFIYTDGAVQTECISSYLAPMPYWITSEQHPTIVTPSIAHSDNLSEQWHLAGQDYDYADAVVTALNSIREPGVYPVTCTVYGKQGDIHYRETSAPSNYIVASGVLPNSVLTFSDVHMEFEGIGAAINETIQDYDGKIPSLVICTGDWANGHGSTDTEYAAIMSRINAQLSQLDTVYVAGNHEPGSLASIATKDSDLGADSSFIDNGYGQIFNSTSAGVTGHGKNSRYTGPLAVYGINYDGLKQNDAVSYSHIVDHAAQFLKTVAAADPETMVIFSTHAGTHVLSDKWSGGASYNINDSDRIVAAINEAAQNYNLDVLFLFGHDHSKNEEEFLHTRGETINVPVDSSSLVSKSMALSYTYAHAGYLTSSIGAGHRHYTLLTWDDNSITYNLRHIGGDTKQTVIERLPAPQYQLIKGNGSTWTKGSSQSLRFEAKRNGYDLAYVLFDHACIDGSTLSSSDYEISSGSIILDLRSSYLETLKPGTHTIELFFSDGSVNGTFTVHSPSSPAVPLPARKAIPDTGDPFSIRRWASLLIAGVFGTAISLFLLYRYHE